MPTHRHADVKSHARPVLVRSALSVAAAAMLWGSAGVVGRLATDVGVTPLAVASSRLTVAAIAVPVLLLITRGARRRHGRPAHTLHDGTRPRHGRDSGAISTRPVALVTTGGLLALYQGAFFAAVDLAGVTVATLVALGAAPVLVALAGPLAGDARPDRRTWAGIAAALLGLVLLVGADVPGGVRGLIGVALALTSGAGYATITLLGRSLRDIDPLAVLAVAFPVGAVLLAPALPGLLPALGDLPTAMSLLYLGVLPTALAYVLFLRGTAVLPGAVVATVTLIEPATATALAAIVLGERVGWVGGVGGLLVVAGVVVVSRRPGPGAAGPRGAGRLGTGATHSAPPSPFSGR